MILAFCFRGISYDPLDREEGIICLPPDLDSLGKAKVESIEKQKDNNDENEDSCDINFTLKESLLYGHVVGL